MNRFDGKPVYHCMVEGCSNEMDPGSTQSLCRPCYDVITTGNTDKYYANHYGSTWIGQIISWNYNLRQEVEELEYNQKHAYSFEDGTMSLTDLRNFYVEHKNYAETIAEKQSLRIALDKKTRENLSLIHENQALKKDNKQKDEINDGLRKELGDLKGVHENLLAVSHKQCSELVTSQFVVKSLREENEALRKEVKELEYNQDHAYLREDDKYMSLNDLRNFYVDHNNLYGKALGSSVIDKRLLKDAQDALDKKNMENLSLRDLIRDLEKDHVYKSQIIDSLRKEIDRANLDHYNNVILKKGHEQKDQHIDSLRKEIEALNYNIDHAHQIDFDKYMSLDDLCIFYTENKNVYDLAERQRNRMVSLELQLKKDNETIKHQDETIQAFKKELDSMEGKLAKKEDFATKTKEHFEKRAEAAGEKVRFDAYTDGFYKGFDLGFEKAKDQYYE